MPISSFQEENIQKLEQECSEHLLKLKEIKNTTITQMWLYELNECKKEIKKYRKLREKRLG